ncbi:unnamed protein product, partial [Brachionus calyciflorus]
MSGNSITNTPQHAYSVAVTQLSETSKRSRVNTSPSSRPEKIVDLSEKITELTDRVKLLENELKEVKYKASNFDFQEGQHHQQQQLEQQTKGKVMNSWVSVANRALLASRMKEIEEREMSNSNSNRPPPILIQLHSDGDRPVILKASKELRRPNDSEQERVKSDVNNYYESIRDKVFDEIFTCSDLIYEINKLEYGKAPGYDFVVNEMVINAKDSPMFIQILVTFFNSIISYGYFPKNFNTSLLTPIPKKGISKTPFDFRPISVSEISKNQFGYKKLTSCKHAYYLVNEVVHFYTSGKSTIHVVSLDSSKAFDKMWRSRLFYKLKSKVEPVIWRSLFMYYGMSEIVIKINGEKSKPAKITEGVKQG